VSTLPIYGLAAEFDNPVALLAAANSAREAGYQKMSAYSPYPVEGLDEALGPKREYLPLIVLLGGIIGGLTGYLLQYFTAVVTYPLNIGGRPLHSWPAFIPVTFECTILGAALSAVFGMLALNGLPQPYHPLFHLPRFARVSRDLFFLCIERRDPLFDAGKTREFLTKLNPTEVTEVPQ
jgi:Protein of unknown function (DUF3341)